MGVPYKPVQQLFQSKYFNDILVLKLHSNIFEIHRFSFGTKFQHLLRGRFNTPSDESRIRCDIFEEKSGRQHTSVGWAG